MDGPCEEATRENLSFVAEQVSHHPPSKSAFGKLLMLTNKQSCLTFWLYFFQIHIFIPVLKFEVDQFKTSNLLVKIVPIYP